MFHLKVPNVLIQSSLCFDPKFQMFSGKTFGTFKQSMVKVEADRFELDAVLAGTQDLRTEEQMFYDWLGKSKHKVTTTRLYGFADAVHSRVAAHR